MRPSCRRDAQPFALCAVAHAGPVLSAKIVVRPAGKDGAPAAFAPFKRAVRNATDAWTVVAPLVHAPHALPAIVSAISAPASAAAAAPATDTSDALDELRAENAKLRSLNEQMYQGMLSQRGAAAAPASSVQ